MMNSVTLALYVDTEAICCQWDLINFALSKNLLKTRQRSNLRKKHNWGLSVMSKCNRGHFSLIATRLWLLTFFVKISLAVSPTRLAFIPFSFSVNSFGAVPVLVDSLTFVIMKRGKCLMPDKLVAGDIFKFLWILVMQQQIILSC